MPAIKITKIIINKVTINSINKTEKGNKPLKKCPYCNWYTYDVDNYIINKISCQLNKKNFIKKYEIFIYYGIS